MARVGIGYVTGANDFFHLRPSQAKRLKIPEAFLQPTVRNGRSLPLNAVTQATVAQWRRDDMPNFLLRIRPNDTLPAPVKQYLDTPEAQRAREAYKCRVRSPWYAVPDVRVPDAFLTYMSGRVPTFVANHGAAACPNTIHAVHLHGPDLTRAEPICLSQLQKAWSEPLTQLSCEVEGHPLGGGMLKLEPREAAAVLFALHPPPGEAEKHTIAQALATMRRWRHDRNA